MKNKKNNYIPPKNYIIALFICFITIFLTYYIFSWYKVAKEKKMNESYLISSKTISLEVTGIDEIENTFTEAPSEYFVYIGYHNDENVYNLERSLKKIIDKYTLNDLFYYIDVTKLKEEEDYIRKLNEALDLQEVKVESIPTIIYFKEGKVNKDAIITRDDDNMMDVGDFEKLLQMYEFKKVS